GRLVHDEGEALTIFFGRHDVRADEAVEQSKRCRGILREGAQITKLAIRQGDPLLQTLPVAPGEGTKPAPEIEMKHERPASEQLFGKEFREHAIPRRIVTTDAKEVVRVSGKHKRGGRAGEIQVGELRGPRGKPRRQLRRPTRLHVGGHWRSTPRRSDSSI